MRSDVPAALPLIAYIAGLVCGWSAREAVGLILVAALLVLLKRARICLIVLCAAIGIVRAGDHRARSEPGEQRFTLVEAEIDRDWTRRGEIFALRVSHGGRPLTIYTHFEPKPIDMERWVLVEGFLRENDRGERVITVKSPRLLSYRGLLSPFDPGAWNRALANRLRPLASTYPAEVALIEALALGRGERLSEEIRDNYKRGGTYHLLVFSGLQIAFAAAVIAALLRSLHAPRASDWSLVIFSIIAPMFIGSTASVSRASIGIGLYGLSRILHRPTTLENLWCVAALLRLIIAPSDLTNAAFQLTYAGAGALLFIAKPLARGKGRWLMYAMAAECAVTPLTLFHFHQYALGGGFTTLLLTPVVFAMLVVAVFASALPVSLLLRTIGFLHLVCTHVNDLASPLAGAYASPPLSTLAIAYGASLIILAFFRRRLSAVAMITTLLVPTAAAVVIAHHDVEGPTITVLDVGQGDAILMRMPGHAVLVDGGSRYSNVVPLLLDRGVRRLHAVILTHVHPDHCGGLPEVLSRLDVNELWVSPRRFAGECAQKLLQSASAAQVPIHLLRDDERRAMGGMALHALLVGRSFKRAAENNSSVVLRVAIGRKSILLTGDIEREAEAFIARRRIRADVLKVAHHGSRSSTTEPILNAVAPRIALLSCGRRNLFGHPHREVLAALQRRGIRLFRTDTNGSIEVHVDGDHISVQHEIDTPP